MNNKEKQRNLIKEYQSQITQNKKEDGTLDNTYSVTGNKAIAQKALDELIKLNTPYIHKIALVQYKKLGQTVEIEDLVQEGKIGLIKAIQKFELDKKVLNPNTNKMTNLSLLTFAHSHIRAEMQSLSHRSNQVHIPTHIQRHLRFEKISNKSKNTDKYKVLAKKALHPESLEDIMTNVKKQSTENIRAIKSGDDTVNNSMLHIFSPTNKEAIEMLTPIQWKIVQMRYGILKGEEGLITKTKQIAEILNMSKMEVDDCLKKAKKILLKNMEKIKA